MLISWLYLVFQTYPTNGCTWLADLSLLLLKMIALIELPLKLLLAVHFRTYSTVCSLIMVHPHKLLLHGGFSTGSIYCWDLTSSKLVQTKEHGGPLQFGHSLLHHTLWAEGSVLWESAVCGGGPDLP